MSTLEEHKACIAEREIEVTAAVFDLLTELEKKRPGAVHFVLEVAQAAISARMFNNYGPIDTEAWEVVHHPIMLAAHKEFVRIHLLAIMHTKLSEYQADKMLLDIEQELALKIT